MAINCPGQDFHVPLSEGSERLREILEHTPRRYSRSVTEVRSQSEAETCYMATTRGLYLSVLMGLRDPQHRCFNDLIVEEVVKKMPRADGEPVPEIYCPLPAEMSARVVPKQINPYIPGFLRAVSQALLPRGNSSFDSLMKIIRGGFRQRRTVILRSRVRCPSPCGGDSHTKMEGNRGVVQNLKSWLTHPHPS